MGAFSYDIRIPSCIYLRCTCVCVHTYIYNIYLAFMIYLDYLPWEKWSAKPFPIGVTWAPRALHGIIQLIGWPSWIHMLTPCHSEELSLVFLMLGSRVCVNWEDGYPFSSYQNWTMIEVFGTSSHHLCRLQIPMNCSDSLWEPLWIGLTGLHEKGKAPIYGKGFCSRTWDVPNRIMQCINNDFIDETHRQKGRLKQEQQEDLPWWVHTRHQKQHVWHIGQHCTYTLCRSVC